MSTKANAEISSKAGCHGIYCSYQKGVGNMLISKIPKTANDVAPISTPDNWTSFFQAIHMFSDDFMESGRNDDSEQEHKKSLSYG